MKETIFSLILLFAVSWFASWIVHKAAENFPPVAVESD